MYLGSPLAFSTQPPRRESGSGLLPWGTGGKMLWGGMYVCVCMSFVNESIYQVLGMGDTGLLKVCLTVLMQLFIGHSPFLRINPVN